MRNSLEYEAVFGIDHHHRNKFELQLDMDKNLQSLYFSPLFLGISGYLAGIFRRKSNIYGYIHNAVINNNMMVWIPLLRKDFL
jgi:hypothetical protein